MSRTAKTQQTRDNILNAAESLFSSQGYQATTINEVAGEVGIQGPAIYKHFANKRALFEEVVERLFAPFTELLEAKLEQEERQLAIIRQHLANPNASRILQHATLSGGEDLELLVERWYLAFFGEARSLATSGTAGFTPVSVMAAHSMLLGYLSLAPLHERIFGEDPLRTEALEELTALQLSIQP